MFANKFVILLALNFAVVLATPQFPGAVSRGNLQEAEAELSASLTKLAAGDGPNYKVGKVYSASKQVVEGLRRVIVADLVDAAGNTKKCDVTIWSRPWLPNGIEVIFQCGSEPELTKKYSA